MLILDALSCTVFIGRVMQRKIWGGKIKEPKIWAVHRGGAMWGVCVGVVSYTHLTLPTNSSV